MLNSARHHNELAFLQPNRLVAKFNPKTSLYHQKHFVFVLMVMPDEFALQLIELDQLAIEFSRNVGLPVLVDLGKFVGDVDFVHNARR